MSDLFTQKSFWAALLTLAVIVVSAFVPGFGLDVEHTAGLAVVVGVYIVGLAINPADHAKSMLLSRKFWVSLFGVAVIFLDAFHVLPVQFDIAQLAALVVIVAAYVFALAKDPGKGWRGLLASRKFWAALVGIVMVFLDAFRVVLPAGFTSEQVVSIAVLCGGVIAGFGLQGSQPAELEPETPPADDEK